jgi:Ca2+-binding EF-hand superfamily protein
MSGGFLALQQKKSRERRKLVDLEDAFREADKNKDGRLSVQEWCTVLAATGHENPRSDKWFIKGINGATPGLTR